MDLSSALTIEGILQKQSPSILKNFQSRYFAVRGKGEFLVWFKKKPVKPDQNPQGIISIEGIVQIKQNQNDQRIFYIEYMERKFTLRAENQSIKERWVNSLKLIINYQQKINKNRKKDTQNTNQSWKWTNIANKQISEQIKLQNQQMILQDGDDNKGSRSQAMLTQIFKQKINDPDVEKCIVYGFYSKKGMLTNTTRWFMLVSQINLLNESDEQLYFGMPQLLEQISKVKKVPQKVEQVPKKKRRKLSSDEESQEDDKKKQSYQQQKILKVNYLYEYDQQTKSLKHKYDLLNIIEYEMNGQENPYSLKILYEQTINQEEEETKQVEVIIMNQFLIEIRKIFKALNMIFQKFNLAQQRQKMLNLRSKRYAIKKWKFVSEQNWMVPQNSKQTFGLLINKKCLKFNKIQIDLDLIGQFKEENMKIGTQQQKQSAVLTLNYKKLKQDKQTQSINFVFISKEFLKKFIRKLTRNLSKIQEQKKVLQQKMQHQKKIEQNKINPDTYLIDKKIRQSQSSIKVNFYDMMDRDLIPQKNQAHNTNNGGFWNTISSFFCATSSQHDSS